jgi:rod shape-determining protein MreD
MNKYLSIIFLVLLSVVFITIQTTLLSPHNLNYYYPDLNLILIVFLAIFSEVRGGFFLTLGNGYMMDVLSGNLPGTFTISRLSAYLLVRSGSNHVYLRKALVQGLVIFLATIFTWIFILTIIKIKKGDIGDITAKYILIQGIVNALFGIPIFWMIHRINARFQK